MDHEKVTYSLQSMHTNQTLTALRDFDPVLYQLTLEMHEEELAQIDSQIKDCAIPRELIVLQVRRWVVVGGIEHDFSRTILEEIAAKYISIG